VSRISTHVLDISRGRPGSGVAATLEFRTATGWEVRGSGTNDDGRIDSLLAEDTLVRGTYRGTFDTSSYFRLKGLGKSLEIAPSGRWEPQGK
jgi:5-hydroxyisourate hydrolase